MLWDPKALPCHSAMIADWNQAVKGLAGAVAAGFKGRPCSQLAFERDGAVGVC